MRKFIIGLATVVMCLGIDSSNIHAQGFEKGKIYVDLGVGLPRYARSVWGLGYGYSHSSYRTPSLSLGVRYGFLDYLSGGLYAGYAHNGWKNAPGTYDERYTYVPVGIGASFHIWSFLNKTLDLGLGVEELDLYHSIYTGAQIRIRSEVKNNVKIPNRTTVSPYFGTMIGARYFFLPFMGAHVEFGYGMNSYIKGGLTFKF